MGIIPARAGSKGIPDKNVRKLQGQPLIYYSAAAGRASNVLDRIILSTESAEIAKVGREVGLEVPFMRPPDLAQDDTPMVPVIRHAVLTLIEQGWRPNIVVLLQPTAPLRRPNHIATAVEMLVDEQCDSVVSVVEVPHHYSPGFVMKISQGRLESFLPDGLSITRRQDAPTAYSRDGTVYAFWIDLLLEKDTIYGDDCRPLVIPHDESVNLDTLADWETAQILLDPDRRAELDRH